MAAGSTTRNTSPPTPGAGRQGGCEAASSPATWASEAGGAPAWNRGATEARLGAVILSALAAAGDNGTGVLGESGRQMGSEAFERQSEILRTRDELAPLLFRDRDWPVVAGSPSAARLRGTRVAA